MHALTTSKLLSTSINLHPVDDGIEGASEWTGTIRDFLAENEGAFDDEYAQIVEPLYRNGSVTIGGGMIPMFTLHLLKGE